MDILSFINKFDLHSSSIENIGYEFFNDQLVITVSLCNWRQLNYKEDQPENILGNLIFYGTEEIKINPKQFKLYSNEILNVQFQQNNESSNRITIGFLTQEPEGFVELSFKAKSVEWDPINPYL